MLYNFNIFYYLYTATGHFTAWVDIRTIVSEYSAHIIQVGSQIYKTLHRQFPLDQAYIISNMTKLGTQMLIIMMKLDTQI